MEHVMPNIWQRSKLLIKLLMIGALILILMIPAYFVENLVKEREQRQKDVFQEVSSKWAGKQTITGPILILPYNEQLANDTGKVVTGRKLAYILPDVLNIESNVNPVQKHRGIFQAMLYSAQAKLSGSFRPIPLKELDINATDVIWNEAYVCMNLSDSKGLNNEIKINWNGSPVLLNPAPIKNGIMEDGFAAVVSVNPDAPINFTSEINLNGSEQLSFIPTGAVTTVRLSSTWPDPSFIGGQLPQQQPADSGFKATWTSLAHSRNFPQAWKEKSYNLASSSFGTNLFIPVNGYQKTLRSVKYAILCILLTFAAFFVIETVNKKSIHPFQYVLIGLALILFYTLLLSISEYTGFNVAYILASLATVGLIGWFVKDLLQSSKLSSVLAIVLLLVYSYVFTTLQLEDFSLLLGSVGLFLTLATVMHFSKKIQW